MSGKPSESSLEMIERVAIVLTELRAGGMERVVMHLANSLAAQGVKPLVVCLGNEGVLAGEFDPKDIHVVALNSTRAYDVRGLWRLAQKLQRFKPDVINVHDYSSLPYVAVAGLLRPHCPIVFTAHGLLYHGFEDRARRYRFFSWRVSALTAVSPEVAKRHQAFLDWQGPVQLVPNGVPSIQSSPELRRQMRQALAVPEDEFVFLAVGNPRPEKAFEDLIAACSMVQRMTPKRRFSVWIAGSLREDDYCRNLQRQAAAAGVPGLRLLGFRADVHQLYSAADALVVSSRSEGLPMVVLEAMTAGLPILSTAVGGIPDAVPQDCGRMVEPANPSNLANGMLEFLQLSKLDRLAMGGAARQYALQRFGLETMTSRYLEAFANARCPNGRVSTKPAIQH